MKITSFLLLTFCLCFISCEQVFLEDPPLSAKAIFDEAWTFADQEYSFFEYKNIDWDDVYDQYVKEIKPEMTSEELFDLIGDMLYELRDGHVNLRASFDISRNWRWYLDAPPNYDYDLLERNYFKEEEQYVGPFIVYDFGDIVYVHYRSFSFDVSDSRLTYITNTFKDREGLIFDVRNNGGGSSGNVFKIASRFTDEKVLVGRERDRNGFEHTDFSEWRNTFVEPYEPDEEIEDITYRFTKPIVVLTNRSSYSASSFFTQYMRALPNVTVIGDSTGGGGGSPSVTELANGWILRVSNSQFESPDGFIIEDGVPADVEVELMESDRANGEDTILEAALELLREG